MGHEITKRIFKIHNMNLQEYMYLQIWGNKCQKGRYKDYELLNIQICKVHLVVKTWSWKEKDL